MEIKGEIIEIIYQNEINSYTIANLDMEEEVITIVGYLPFIQVGDTLNLHGKYVEHQDYGRQFKVDTFEKRMPETKEALQRYLSNGMIKGIGPATAKKIVERFGDEAISIIRFEPRKLAQIRGINIEKADEISKAFIENWEVWQLVSFLEPFGIGPQSAPSIFKRLGINAREKIEENPYILGDIINRIDFKKIDKIALDLGIELNNKKRIQSGIKYALNCSTTKGNTAALMQNLIEFVSILLNVEQEDVKEAIIELRAKQEIYIENRENDKWIYLDIYYLAEKNVAQILKELSETENSKYISSIEDKINHIQEKQEIVLSDKQKEAIAKINDNNICIITGGPGTGKTTVIKTIIELYKEQGKKTVLCAPTGRAAKRMAETTGQEAKTLHRLLEIGKFVEDDTKEIYSDLDVTPIDADIVIVDEMSMVDIFLMNYLVKAIYKGTKLILVGDIDQLPSVGPGNVLKDLIESEMISTIVLNQIFRQAAQSQIIVNSHRVNQGQGFLLSNEQTKRDFFYIKEWNQYKILENVVSLSKERLKKYGDYDFFKNIQVISPTKKGELGTKNLNKILQNELNPLIGNKAEKQFGSVSFRQGDRIMQIKNNYDIFWEKYEPKYETGTGVFNGEFGTIIKIDDREKQVKIQFDDDKIVIYSYQDLEQIEHAYAITVHKSQGSEFDVVILPIFQSAPMLLTRNLLYTGMTRAKKLLIIIGNTNILEFMIQNVDNKKRNTGLGYKMQMMLNDK